MVTSLDYRNMDRQHRILQTVLNAQSTIGPVFGDSPNLPDVYYVDSGSGSDTNDGRDPGFPLATIDAAINKCTASQGDVILVQPGHSETLTTQISLDVIGVSIVGVGQGTLRPNITINGAIDGIDIGAANCAVINLQFNESTAAATSMINVDAANALISGCHFDLGASDTLGSITVTASGELPVVEDCTVMVTADGPDEWILFEGVVDRPIIRGNTVLCSDGTNAFDDAAINAAAVAVTNLLIEDNTFLGQNVASAVLAGTGLVGATIQNNIYGGGATAPVSTADVFYPGLGYRVVKTDGDPTAAAGSPDALFTVTGKVLVTLLFGEVTTAISGGTLPETALQSTTNNIAIAASTVITGDAQGTLYMVSGDTGVILNGADAPTVDVAQIASAGHQPFILDGDGIEQLNGGGAVAAGGVIEWTLYYIPLEDNARVVAAA